MLKFKSSLKNLKTMQDGGFSVSFDVPETEWNNIKELPTLNQRVLEVTIEEEVQ